MLTLLSLTVWSCSTERAGSNLLIHHLGKCLEKGPHILMEFLFHVTYKFVYIEVLPRNRLRSFLSTTFNMTPNTKCTENLNCNFIREAFGLMDTTWHYAFILFIYSDGSINEGQEKEGNGNAMERFEEERSVCKIDKMSGRKSFFFFFPLSWHVCI